MYTAAHTVRLACPSFASPQLAHALFSPIFACAVAMSKRGECAGDELAPPAKRACVEGEEAPAAAAAPRVFSREEAQAIALSFATARLARLDAERARAAAAPAAADSAADDARPPRARHECPDLACGADFASPGDLKRHVDAVHLGLKPHDCSQCEATFTEVAHLKRHLSAVPPRAQAAHLQPVRRNLFAGKRPQQAPVGGAPRAQAARLQPVRGDVFCCEQP
jgi:hypothetical protein